MSHPVANSCIHTLDAVDFVEDRCAANSNANEVLLFAFEYPPVSGGISRLCAEIGKGLRNDQTRVSVLTQESADEIPSPLLPETRVDRKRPFREWKAFRWLQKFKHNAAAGKPMVVCGIWYPEGLIAYLAGIRPLVILAHGAELLPPVSRWRRRLWNVIQRCVLESADLVIANSDYTKRLALRAAPEAIVHAIPLVVDAERFAPADRAAAKDKFGVSGKTVLCTVSRLQPYKGHDVVLRAIANLAPDEREKIVYLIAGRGSHEQALKELAAKLGINQQVRWLGFVAEANLPEIYCASDLFVLCTREVPHEQAVEGFGLVFLEAQASGVPVVGTKTGGIPEAIKDGEGGWLIEQDDCKKLTGILRQLVLSPEVFRKAGMQARQRILRECTWKSYNDDLSSALRSVDAPPHQVSFPSH
jgi:phosphatidyl-myo-inositol dimannoside synthase